MVRLSVDTVSEQLCWQQKHLNYFQLKNNIRMAPKSPTSLVYVAFNLPCSDAILTSFSSTLSERRPLSHAAHIEVPTRLLEDAVF